MQTLPLPSSPLSLSLSPRHTLHVDPSNCAQMILICRRLETVNHCAESIGYTNIYTPNSMLMPTSRLASTLSRCNRTFGENADGLRSVLGDPMLLMLDYVGEKLCHCISHLPYALSIPPSNWSSYRVSTYAPYAHPKTSTLGRYR